MHVLGFVDHGPSKGGVVLCRDVSVPRVRPVAAGARVCPRPRVVLTWRVLASTIEVRARLELVMKALLCTLTFTVSMGLDEDGSPLMAAALFGSEAGPSGRMTTERFQLLQEDASETSTGQHDDVTSWWRSNRRERTAHGGSSARAASSMRSYRRLF